VEEGSSNHVSDADPWMQKPNEKMYPDIQDDAKSEYALLGPCRPKGHEYPMELALTLPVATAPQEKEFCQL